MQAGAPAVSEQVPCPLQVASAGATQVVPQKEEPDAHPQVFWPEGGEKHVAVLPGAAGQAVQRVPQEFTSPLGRHWLPQRWKPALQAKSQAAPLHTGDAFAGVEHAPQPVPHLRKPELQVKSQLVPLQVAAALAGGVHVARLQV